MTTEYQKDGVAPSIIYGTAVLLAVFIGGSVLEASFIEKEHAKSQAAEYLKPAEPRLLVNEYAVRKDDQNKQRANLNSYGWVNRAEGTVRVPIGRAMEMLERKGSR